MMTGFDAGAADQVFGGAGGGSSAPVSFDTAAADEALAADTQAMLTLNAHEAVSKSPDQVAHAARLSRSTGAPIGAVMADISRFEAMDIGRLFWLAPEATRAFLGNPTNAALAKDDVRVLSRIERSVSYLRASASAGGYDLLAAGSTILDTINPWTITDQEAAVLFKNDPDKLAYYRDESLAMFLSRFARARTKDAERVMRNVAPAVQAEYGDLKYATTDPMKAAWASPTKMIGDALRSLPSALALAVSLYLTRRVPVRPPALIGEATEGAAAQAGVQSAASTAARVGAGGVEGIVGYAQQALQTQEQVENLPDDVIARSPEYQRLLREGYAPSAARLYVASQTAKQAGLGAGAVDMAVNMVGGHYLGHLTGEGGSRLPRTVRGATAEGATEFIQSGGEQLAQNLAVRQNANPDQQLGEDVLESMLQGLFAGGLTGGAFAGVQTTGQRAEIAQQQAKSLAEVVSAVQESKLAARDPESMAAFIRQADGKGPLHVSARNLSELYQSGVIDQATLDALDVTEQLPEAMAAGGDVRISLDKYLMAVARMTPDARSQMISNTRIEADGMTAAEAEAFLSDTLAQDRDAGDQLERMETQHEGRESGQEAEDTGSVRASPAFRRSADIVRASIKNQLDAVGRFGPQVNDAYSSMMGSFYAVQAVRLGVTPEDLFQRFPLKVVAGDVTGEGFGQAQAAYPPKGWRHSQTGADAAALWNGDETTDAVFWTDLSGKLAQDAPDLAGYSHSIDRSAVEHIRKRHGDAVTETPRGQIAVAANDLARIPDMITHYDAIRRITDRNGHPLVAYAKRFDDGLTVYLEGVSGRRQNMRGISMRRYLTSSNADTILERAVRDELDAQGERSIPSHSDSIVEDGGDFNQEARGIDAPDIVASIGGEEIAPRSADVKTLRAAARDWYETNLRDTTVVNKSSGREVRFANAKKAFSTSANPVKLRLFAALQDVVANGTIENSVVPVDQAQEPSTKEYHWLTAWVEMDGTSWKVGVTIREDQAGNLYYNHNPIKEVATSLTRSDPAHKAGAGENEETTLQQSILNDNGGVNLYVLNHPARGSFSPATNTIALLKNADLSTFLHESGHFFLDAFGRLAADPASPNEIRADMDAALRWIGVAGETSEARLAAWRGMDVEGKRSGHEQWARGFEAYLLEGKAPSIEMQGLFQQFRAWLLDIYRSLSGLNVELTPEVRGVFDRMLGAERNGAVQTAKPPLRGKNKN